MKIISLILVLVAFEFGCSKKEGTSHLRFGFASGDLASPPQIFTNKVTDNNGAHVVYSVQINLSRVKAAEFLEFGLETDFVVDSRIISETRMPKQTGSELPVRLVLECDSLDKAKAIEELSPK